MGYLPEFVLDNFVGFLPNKRVFCPGIVWVFLPILVGFLPLFVGFLPSDLHDVLLLLELHVFVCNFAILRT